MTHPVVQRLLGSMPEVTVERAGILHRGEFHAARQTILIRHGLRGPQWLSTIVHEALHAQRGDVGCSDSAVGARQEARCDRDAARLLINIDDLAEAAAAFAGDGHRIADELGVDYETVANRVKHLHPAERHYLRRRLEHLEESS